MENIFYNRTFWVICSVAVAYVGYYLYLNHLYMIDELLEGKNNVDLSPGWFTCIHTPKRPEQ